MPLSEKQREYIRKAARRWNFKVGAVRSGKTFLDVLYTIPRRVTACEGGGLILLAGHTMQAVERNILNPMRALYGPQAVGTVRAGTGTAELFGRQCHIAGADKTTQTPRIQGTSVAYCYGDEVTNWNREFFEMLKSRLDKPWSVFDGTANPGHPNHWLKRFLDSGADIFEQRYTIDDNPNLPAEFVRSLKMEYAGTMYYERYILGLWSAAEGSVYRQFAQRPAAYTVRADESWLRDAQYAVIGVDFGGTRSLTAFVATCVHAGFSKLTVLADHHLTGGKGDIDAVRVCGEFVEFVRRVQARYPRVFVRYACCDSEAQYLINSLRRAVREAGLPLQVADAAKRPIMERIVAANTLLNTGRLWVGDGCRIVAEGLAGAVWNPDKPDARLDNFHSDIDILDAFEYSFERFIGRLIPRGVGGGDPRKEDGR